MRSRLISMLAINQKAGPLLISASLLSHILNRRQSTFASTNLLRDFMKNSFAAKDWVIARMPPPNQDLNSSVITDESWFYLLIPKAELGPNIDQLDNAQKVALLRDRFGFAVKEADIVNEALAGGDSLRDYFSQTKPIDGQAITPYAHFLSKKQDSYLGIHLRKRLKDLVISRGDDEIKGRNPNPFRYIVLLMGHGTYNEDIAELSINGDDSEYKKLLDMLKDDKKKLVVQSCMPEVLTLLKFMASLEVMIE